MAESRRPIPRLPGGPDPNQPTPRDAVAGIDLTGYARIAAALTMTPRAAALADAGLDEGSWMEVEKTWLLRLATALLQGDQAPCLAYEEAFAAAQSALLPKGPPARSLEEYAAIVGRMEAGQPPVEVLADAGLSMAEWTALLRDWTARVARDPELAAELRRRVAGAARA